MIKEFLMINHSTPAKPAKMPAVAKTLRRARAVLRTINQFFVTGAGRIRDRDDGKGKGRDLGGWKTARRELKN